MTEFAKRLTKYREERKLKVSEAAALINVPLSTYRDWENGVKILGPQNFVKIAKAFSMPISVLMSGEEITPKTIIDDIIDIEEKISELKKKIATQL